MAEIEVAKSISSLSKEEWNRLVGDDSPFLEWEWLASLEQAEAVSDAEGWRPRPITVREGGRLIAACPAYLKAHSEGEFVFDWGWADAASRAGIRYYPKLLIGVPFTPVSGARILVAPGEDRPAWERQLARFSRELCLAHELSGVHVNFCTSSELEALVAEGYLPRIGFQYHWHNAGYRDFADYLEHLRSKRRKAIRRERRELSRDGLEIELYVGEDIPEELFDTMYRFYLANIRAHAWGRQYLNQRFFRLLCERFRERLVFIVARSRGELIAGTFNVRKGDALFGRYWGAIEDVRFLHFELCYYATIEYCISEGIQRFEPGAGGDYKQLRGFDAQPTLSGHFLAEPRLSAAVAEYLERERAQAEESIEWLRDHSALKGS